MKQQRGRPQDLAAQIQRLAGDPDSKQRLLVLLRSITGDCTIEEACAGLHVGPTRFFELRESMLSAALAALAPRPAGRPRHAPPGPAREQQLEVQLADLEEELQCALVRTELALVMPRLLERPAEKKETLARSPRGGARPPLAAPPRTGDDDAPAAR